MAISNKLPIYPDVRGQKWPVTRIPSMRSIIQTSSSGKETRISLWSYPQWNISFEYEYLREQEYRRIVDFFLDRSGQTEAFWLEDKSDNYLMDQLIALGNGEQTQFQIIRLHGNTLEPIFACKDDMQVINPPSGYYINNQGIINFNSPPPPGTQIKVKGGFYYRVRFNTDNLEFEEFIKKIWSTNTVDFITVK